MLISVFPFLPLFLWNSRYSLLSTVLTQSFVSIQTQNRHVLDGRSRRITNKPFVACTQLDQASLGLNREYLVKGMDEKIVAAYYRYMVDVAVLFGADRQRAVKELKESLDFEIGLAKISLPLEERRDAAKLYNPTTVSELQRKYPSVPWLEYLNTLLYPLSIRHDDIIIVNSPKYLSNLEAVLSNTPKRYGRDFQI